MRAGESTFMGCPLSYLHPQAIPLAPRFSGKLHRRTLTSIVAKFFRNCVTTS